MYSGGTVELFEVIRQFLSEDGGLFNVVENRQVKAGYNNTCSIQSFFHSGGLFLHTKYTV